MKIIPRAQGKLKRRMKNRTDIMLSQTNALTTIPIHSTDQNKPPFYYTIYIKAPRSSSPHKGSSGSPPPQRWVRVHCTPRTAHCYASAFTDLTEQNQPALTVDAKTIRIGTRARAMQTAVACRTTVTTVSAGAVLTAVHRKDYTQHLANVRQSCSVYHR